MKNFVNDIYKNVGTTKRLRTLIKAAFQSSGLAIVRGCMQTYKHIFSLSLSREREREREIF